MLANPYVCVYMHMRQSYIVVKASFQNELGHPAIHLLQLNLGLLWFLGKHTDGDFRVRCVHLIDVYGLQLSWQEPFKK